MKFIVLILFLFILYSLGSAMYYMNKDSGQSKRMVKSLAIRVGLSVMLFLLLLLSAQMGWIKPQPARFLLDEQKARIHNAN